MPDYYGNVAQAGAYMLNSYADYKAKKMQLEQQKEEEAADRAFRSSQLERTAQLNTEARRDAARLQMERDKTISGFEMDQIEARERGANLRAAEDRGANVAARMAEDATRNRAIGADEEKNALLGRDVAIRERSEARQDPANIYADASTRITALTELATSIRENENAIRRAQASGEPEDGMYMTTLLAKRDALQAYQTSKNGTLFGSKLKYEVNPQTGEEKISTDVASLNDVLSMRTHLGYGNTPNTSQPRTAETLMQNMYKSMPKSQRSVDSEMPMDSGGYTMPPARQESPSPLEATPTEAGMESTEEPRRKTISESQAASIIKRESARKELERLRSSRTPSPTSPMGKKAEAAKRQRMAELEMTLKNP